MISKAQIKKLSSYKHKKHRNEDKVFVVEGVKMIDELLKAESNIRCLCAKKEWIDVYYGQTRDRVEQLIEVNEEDLNKISSLSTPNQVYAVLEQRKEKEIRCEGNLILVLDGIKDPGNLGTIIRIADWFGIENIICSEDTVDVYNPKVVQSTMGSIFRINVVYYNDITTYISSLSHNYPIYGTIVEGGRNIYQEELTKEGIIIIGSESHGISNALIEKINRPITIPSYSIGKGPESLNAGIATSIICSEFKRR